MTSNSAFVDLTKDDEDEILVTAVVKKDPSTSATGAVVPLLDSDDDYYEPRLSIQQPYNSLWSLALRQGIAAGSLLGILGAQQ